MLSLSNGDSPSTLAVPLRAKEKRRAACCSEGAGWRRQPQREARLTSER